MTIADFVVQHPVLVETLRELPDARFEWEETCENRDGTTQMIFWASGAEHAAVEAAMADDPGVSNPVVLTETDSRRLYRVDFTAVGDETNLMPLFVENGGVLKEAVGTADGWHCRVQFPDRAAYERLYRFCRDHDIGFSFGSLYERATTEEGGAPNLTDPQREALLEAADRGYFEVPRRCTLQELGEALEISDSAVSQRIRRGVFALVEQFSRRP